jgi:hypothetical protein
VRPPGGSYGASIPRFRRSSGRSRRSMPRRSARDDSTPCSSASSPSRRCCSRRVGCLALWRIRSAAARARLACRVALGASTGAVLQMILGQGMRTIVIGVATGFAGAVVLTRAVESLLFGVTATDPLTFGSVTVLVGTALLACYIPARRATKIDPNGCVAPRVTIEIGPHHFRVCTQSKRAHRARNRWRRTRT